MQGEITLALSPKLHNVPSLNTLFCFLTTVVNVCLQMRKYKELTKSKSTMSVSVSPVSPVSTVLLFLPYLLNQMENLQLKLKSLCDEVVHLSLKLNAFLGQAKRHIFN